MAVFALATMSGCVAAEAEPEASAPVVSETSTPTPEPTIRDVDLGSLAWQYSAQGVQQAETVTLTGGTADVGGVIYELVDTQYADLDDDGDEDAVASISRTDGNGFEELWYVWLGATADGAASATQVPWALAQQSRCGTVVDSVTAAVGAVTVVQHLRLPDDASLSCAETGTGEQTRTISLASDAGETWPVQTTPVPAWGGVCPSSPWLHSDFPIEGQLQSAPSAAAPVAVAAGQDGALYQLDPAPLMEREGWVFVGFVQTAVDVGAAKLFCAWAPSSP